MKLWMVVALLVVTIGLAVFGTWTVAVHAGQPYVVRTVLYIHHESVGHEYVIARASWPNPLGKIDFYSARRDKLYPAEEFMSLTETVWEGGIQDVSPRQNQIVLIFKKQKWFRSCSDGEFPEKITTRDRGQH